MIDGGNAMTEIEPGVHLVPVGGGEEAGAPETNIYIVQGRDSVAFVDSGFPEEEKAEPLLKYWRKSLGAPPVSWVLVTHRHHEHAGGVKVLKDATGAQVAAGAGDAHEIDVEFGAGSSLVDRELTGEETFDLGGSGGVIRAIATPGHTAGNMCFLLEGARLLFTGDHVMGQGTVVVRTDQGGSMAQHVASLRLLKGLGARAMLSGHGPAVSNVDAKIDELVLHRTQREEQFVALLQEGITSVEDMLARLYSDIPKRRLTLARHQAIAHLEKLREEGRAVATEADTSYRPA
jgi:glyoxylase-like metal-dependent hydrolase (beta-lactamase superfamily II)